MKKLFEDVSKEVVPKVIQSLQWGQKFLSNILNNVDFDLTRTIEILKDKQEKIKQFIQHKESLMREIERKEFEVSKLREQINIIKGQSNSAQLDYLRNELNHKLDDLLNSQRNYYELEGKIEVEQKRVEELVSDKQKLELDRNAIKSKYEKIRVTLAENKKKTEKLKEEILELQGKQHYYEELLQNSVAKEDVIKYEELLKGLQQEYAEKKEDYNHIKLEHDQMKLEQKEIEQSLLQKISEISKLTIELNGANLTLEEIMKEKVILKSKLLSNEQVLKQSKDQIASLEEKMEGLRRVEAVYEAKYQTALQQSEKARAALTKNYDDFTNEMNTYEERIKILQNQLLDKQNEIAIVKAENGEVDELSEEEKKIMEREFEPRFNILYKDCYFHREFLSDFYRITPSDRLKVEVVIMNLNYHYNTTITNIRPNTIKTKTSTILEYPFGTDSVGRIYFNKENHTIHLYRLSRTKNGKGKLTQDNVIEWLKKNK